MRLHTPRVPLRSVLHSHAKLGGLRITSLHNDRALLPATLRDALLPPLFASAHRCKRFATMDVSKASPTKELPLGIDEATEEEYASQSKLLQEFTSIATIDKAWIIPGSGNGSQAMFSFSQPNVISNKKRKFMLSSHISKESSKLVNFQWGSFPIEMTRVSVIVPSPSGAKLLVVRNPEKDSPCQFGIWGPAQVEKEFYIPPTVHGSVYTDGWFQGISWNSDESLIAYVAEEPSLSKPTFTFQGYKKGSSTDKDFGNWKGQGEWEEDWGESYAGKRSPALVVINVNRSGNFWFSFFHYP